jgi:hypothetical protein
MSKKIEIGLLIVFVCLIVAISGCVSFDSVKVVVNHTGSWNGTITDSSGTRSIEGTGDETIDLGMYTGSLKAVVQKKDPESDELIVSIIRGEKTVVSTNTEDSSLDYAIASIYLA